MSNEPFSMTSLVDAPIAISTGCPCGVGPEVSVVAAQQAKDHGISSLLLGDIHVLRRAAVAMGVQVELVAVRDPTDSMPAHALPVFDAGVGVEFGPCEPGKPTPEAGRAQLAWVDHATDLVTSGVCSAIVTGPVSKEVIARSGAPTAASFAGHTEHIARRIHAGPPVMTFVADHFTVGLVTTHLALSDVPAAITREKVAYVSEQVCDLVSLLERRPARVVVAALNPHAGENGMFGHEEQDAIAPGVEDARKALRDRVELHHVVLDGPIAAEAAFRVALDGAYDAVVAMYHDQGTIPMKVKFFGHAVNVTAGLPIVRTSVDHGTAYDIAGKGIADPGSMLEAIVLAKRLVMARAERQRRVRE